MTNKTLQRSWLVQRLRKPRGSRFDNAFSFGGGLKNGGLSDEAMQLLSGVIAFDYMGSAEFELGAVPEALHRMAQADLATTSFEVRLADVSPTWRDERPAPDGTATIYVLCPKDVEPWVVDRVYLWTRDERPDLKEFLQINATLRPYSEWDGDIVGWLELDNGFMFFTDREMWLDTCRLFGVEVEA